jgi:hypothetical protein
MDGKGWRPEYGISPEGIEILGFIEALPREVRLEMADAIAVACKGQGYLSLHDDLRRALARERPRLVENLAKVIPLFPR